MHKPETHQGGIEKQPNEKVYWAARNVLAFAAKATRLQVEGAENLRFVNDTQDGAIIAASHSSMWDVFDLAALNLNRPIRFLGRDTLQRHPLLGRPIRLLAPHARVIFLNREDRSSRQGAAQAALDALNQGDLVGFFPEMTRNKSDDLRDLQSFRYGAVRTALLAEGTTAVLPVGIGYHKGLLAKKSISHTGIVIGDPLYIPHDPTLANMPDINEQLHETVAELKSRAVDLAESRG